MKKIRVVLICLLLALVVFFSFYKSSKPNLEGNWQADTVTFDGKELFHSEPIEEMYGVRQTITIEGDSIILQNGSKKIVASLKISKIAGEKVWSAQLSSTEKALNGTFSLKINTVNFSSNESQIRVRLASDRMLMEFHRDVFINPPKPEFPRRGQV
ncbi:hypothetical protein [Flavobacterium silvaticum]|uniref:Uncharacterized protein n=1 Tax=Flavobacterium silvaticum TaxID=1852020 RepID=A0A972FTK6_9FLAO|nr:hypothetical protein [Flavobacterium silvaticum]NMH29074.1 hypothetical protein [Flavobacterium silvaticum]